MSLKDLLNNLAKGVYDGKYIDNEEHGVSWGFFIDKGTPVQYREGKANSSMEKRMSVYLGNGQKNDLTQMRKKTLSLRNMGIFAICLKIIPK